jgi:hypothetical protein
VDQQGNKMALELQKKTLMRKRKEERQTNNDGQEQEREEHGKIVNQKQSQNKLAHQTQSYHR